MKKKIGNIMIIIGITFVIAALIIYLDLNIKDRKYAEENDLVIEKIKEVIESKGQEEAVEVFDINYVGTLNSYPLIIGGHNSNSQFNKLYKIKEGAEVIIINLQGEKVVYKVKKIETIDGKDIKGMTETDYPLTLFTCTFNNRARLTIRCI